ncbi:hypothetical protein LRAMOSA03756 [Lichtheimia ramosa]|uniref:Uncharacterized protein n=1 Tax=Lichtheimia ramosa TaxID=688394 RepID=A0A077WWW5_9FUNG|nr:hypothetical protein LRAMOSA03756 [Lichtheimia ramosa]
MRPYTDDWEAMFDPQYSMDSPRHKRPGRRKDMPASAPPTPSTGTPALPSIDIIAHSKSQQNMMASSSSQQLSSAPSPHQRPPDQLWTDRMNLLRTIREQGHITEQRLSTPHKQGWKERLREKIDHGLLQEASDESSDEEEDIEKETNQDIEKQQEHEEQEPKQRKRPPYRHSFLYFAFGFLFPPLWIIGAMHVPPQHQSPEGQAIDLQWRRRCRNAFFLFIATVLVVLIIALVLKPASVGWRLSAPLPEGTVHY